MLQLPSVSDMKQQRISRQQKMAKIYSARPNMEYFNKKQRNKKIVMLATAPTTQEKDNKLVSCLVEKCDSVDSIE